MDSLSEKAKRLTRRQSQRRDLSRVVQKWLSKWFLQEGHASRQVPSWLIFDVSQSKGRDAMFTGEVGRSACCESPSICGSRAGL